MISLIAMGKSGLFCFWLTYVFIGMAVGLGRHRFVRCLDAKALPV